MKKGFVLAILGAILTNAISANAGDEILLKSRRFIPAKGVSAAARAKIEAIPKRAHVFIQLEQIPTRQQRKELEAKGIQLLSYIPNKAWFASIPSDKAGEIATFSTVRAISEILPEDKIDHSIREKGVNKYSTNEKGEAKLAVLFFQDVSLNDASTIISNHKGTVIGAAPIINALVVFLPKEAIYELASHDSVCWIDQHYEPTILNDGSRAAIGVNIVQAPPYNLTGTGIIVGEWDGGCVDDTHGDLIGRVIQQRNCVYGGNPNHATHVAGTMLGDGSRSEPNGGTPLQWRGMATDANVVSYLWWLDVDGLNSDYDEAINIYDINLSTNSWGLYDGDCEYDICNQAVDRVVTGSCGKRIPIMWAAGNEGKWSSLVSNAVAKNVVTVGAIYSDLDEVTCFSSLGPTADGRTKPDVVAPGDKTPCEGYGIKSTVQGNTYANYGYFGTSMATPAVSGSVALMLEYWRNTHIGQPDPLPSTIKAILIQTATDLGNTGPDYSSGYGKINVKDAIDLIREDVNDNVILEDSIVEQGDKDLFIIVVPQGQPELKVSLVWDDYPGNPGSLKDLMNDLDLIVKDPGGIRHYPWMLNPTPSHEGDPATRGEDHVNNVEQVYVDNPVSGAWTIEVSETTFPGPVQNYSLVSNNLPFIEESESEQLLHKFDDVNDGDSVLPNNEIIYTIHYGNPYDPNIGTLTDVNIVDYLPEEVDYISSPAGSYDPTTRTVTWNIGTLEPNEPNSVTLTVTVNNLAEPLGTIRNLCILRANEIRPVFATEITDVNFWKPPVIYVDKKAPGYNNGMSWRNAYRDLQDAFARVRAGFGSQIWVAAETYKPTQNPSKTTATFDLVSGVPIYGGFPSGGGELNGSTSSPSLKSRDWVTNETILDGQISGSAFVSCVVTAKDINDTILDGFTIKGSYIGAGIYLERADVEIANCKFIDNSWDGVSCNQSVLAITNSTLEGNTQHAVTAGNFSNVKLANCTIKNHIGNGIYVYDSNIEINRSLIERNSNAGIHCLHYDSTLTLTNSVIRFNGIYEISLENTSSATIKNNWIHNSSGYGIYIYDEEGISAPAIIRNNTIVNNDGYGIYLGGYTPEPNISNCIIRGNNNPGDQLYGCTATYYCTTGDPCFFNPNDSNNLHLDPNSPCIDRGDPNAGYNGETDIDGERRLFDGDSNGSKIVDIGADEYYISIVDFDENKLVNFIDYAVFANAWWSDPNDPDWGDPNCNIGTPVNNHIDLNDLAAFCEEWLWEPAWTKSFTDAGAGIMQTIGQSMSRTTTAAFVSQEAAAVALSVSAEQQLEKAEPIEVEKVDIEEILVWLDEVWLEGELKEVMTKAEYLEFRKAIEESAL